MSDYLKLTRLTFATNKQAAEIILREPDKYKGGVMWTWAEKVKAKEKE